MNLRAACISAVVIVLSAVNARATLIDSFDSGSVSLSVTSSVSYVTKEVHPGEPDVIGGYRDIWLQWSAGATSIAEVVANSGDPEWNGFYFTQGARGVAAATVVWDGPTGLPSGTLGYALNKDLSAATAFSFDIADITGGGVNLTLTVYTDAHHASQRFLPATSLDVGTLTILRSDFTQSGDVGSADFSHVGAIVLKLEGTPANRGADITITRIETIPEPSTFAMVAVGGVVLLGLRRRW
jgi:hypothetical protein